MRAALKLTLLAAMIAVAPSCASKPSVRPIFPSAADLAVEAEPAYPVEALEVDDSLQSTAAAIDAENAWDDAVLIWGRSGWAAVGRVCRWAESLGMKGIDCPPPPE